MLRDRHRDAADVSFLESIGADGRTRDLAGDRHHGHRVHMSIGDGRDEIGRAGAARGHAYADPACRCGVALGGVPGGLLVAHEDVADLGGVHEGVVCREDGATRNAEDHLDTGVLHRPNQALCTRDLLTGRLPWIGAHHSLFPLPLRVHGGAWPLLTRNPPALRGSEGARGSPWRQVLGLARAPAYDNDDLLHRGKSTRLVRPAPGRLPRECALAGGNSARNGSAGAHSAGTQSQTAPRLADPTSRTYFPRTPRE